MSEDKSIIVANLLSTFIAGTMDVEGPDVRNTIFEPSTTMAFEISPAMVEMKHREQHLGSTTSSLFSLRKLEASLTTIELEDSGSSSTTNEVELTVAPMYDAKDFPFLIKTINRYVHNTGLCSHLIFSLSECNHISHHLCHSLQKGQWLLGWPRHLLPLPGPWCYNLDSGAIKVSKISARIHGLECPRRYLQSPIEQHVYRSQGEVLHHIVLHWQPWL